MGPDEQLRVYERLQTALGMRPGESLQDAARRAYRNRPNNRMVAIAVMRAKPFTGERCWKALAVAERLMPKG